SAESPSASRILFYRRGQTVVEIDKRVVRPQVSAHLLSSHHLPRLLQQHPQQLKWLGLQSNTAAALTQLAGTQIHFKTIKLNPLGSLRRERCFPSNGGGMRSLLARLVADASIQKYVTSIQPRLS